MEEQNVDANFSWYYKVGLIILLILVFVEL